MGVTHRFYDVIETGKLGFIVQLKEKKMLKFLLLTVSLLAGCATYEVEPKQPAEKAEIKNIRGMEIYQQNCIACHGNDGTGAIAGVPDLTKVAGFRGNPQQHEQLFQHIEHVKNGLKRPGHPIAMPAKGGNPNLTEQDIREVLKYMHERFASNN